MTNDEKVRAYDMALEAARKELGVDRKEWIVIDKVLKSIFPELRESDDERIIKTLQEYVKDRNWKLNGPSQDEVLAWLEKQKEPKPAEWSEEDELNIGWLIAYLRGENAGEYYDEMMRESLASWLESLRPQYHGDVTMTEAYKMGLEVGKASSWKPSEEKLSALGSYVEELQARATAAVGGWNKFDALIDLYNDLRELI